MMRADQVLKLGILGGGQLGRMLGMAGLPLAVEPVIWDPEPSACARLVGQQICESYTDAAALNRFVSDLAVCTFEFENIPSAILRELSHRVPVYPPLAALEASQDRLAEKQMFAALGINTAPYVAVDSLEDLNAAVAHLGLPAILKTRRLGYDGKGQYVLREVSDIQRAWDALGTVPLILEGFVSFCRELSVIAVRGQCGEMAFYAVSENVHRNGILLTSHAKRHDPLQAQAEKHAETLLEHLQYVGVLCLELFEVDGVLLANEFAPRVHNSGHWTIEGAETSQFENHVRAVLGLPLGSTACLGSSALVNLVGKLPTLANLLSLKHVYPHYYGKMPKHGRKVGHVTVRAENEHERDELVSRILQELT